MNAILDMLKRPLVAAAAGFVLGLIIGLPLLGWGLWPVKWTDAEPRMLREDLRSQYVCMVVDSFTLNKDTALARARLEAAGIDPANASQELKTFDASVCKFTNANALLDFLVGMMQTTPPLPGGTEQPGGQLPVVTEAPGGSGIVPPVSATATPAGAAKSSSPVLLLAILCGAVLLVGGVLAYFLFIRNRKGGAVAPAGAPKRGEKPESEFVAFDNNEDYGEPQELMHKFTTYVIGDDYYNDDFSIDDANGQIIGSIGVEISETIGVGDPKKVTAFLLWLFEKEEKMTVTKVLMSPHAYNDPSIRMRLASRGEPVMIDLYQPIVLQTPRLRLTAKAVDLEFGRGPLPADSYFNKLQIELSVSEV